MSEVKLYNGEVTVIFNEGTHRYQVNDKFVPGVTSILNVINKPLLLDWSADMSAKAFKESVARAQGEGRQIDDKFLNKAYKDAKSNYRAHSDKAKDLGHLIHKGIEDFLNNITYHNHPLVMNFVHWWKNSGATLKGTEQIVYSRKYGYAGTYDVLFDKDGRVYLGDVKTTKRGYANQQGVYVEYVAQLGAYAIAYEEEHGKPIDELCIINPDKEYGELQFITLSELGISIEEAKQAFLKVYELHKALQPLEWKLKKQNTLKKGMWYSKQRLEIENE